MQCEDAVNLISARLDGEISADDRQRLDAHLAECADCRATAEAMQLQDAQLVRGFAPRRQAAEKVADEIAARVRLADKPRARWWVPLVAAAAGFLFAVLLLRPWQSAVQIVPENRGGQIAITQPSTAPHSQLATIGRLDIATGAVEVLPPDESQWEPMATGASVTAACRVRTGPRVRCELAMLDGSQVRLNENSELVLNGPRRVDLKQGQVFSNVARHEDPFQVAVANTTVTALGTRFDISRQSDEIVLAVVQGSTQLNVEGRPQVVNAGQVVKFADGKLTRLQAADQLDRSTQWVYDLLVHKAPGDPEVAERVNDLFAKIGAGKMELLREDELKGLGDRCVLPLTRYLQSRQSDGNDYRRVEAARVIGDVAQPWCIPYLVELLGDSNGNVRYYAAQALERLTARGPGPSPQEWRNMTPSQARAQQNAWQRWWKQNQSKVPGAATAPTIDLPADAVKN